jgi:FKBP-type peptidyl-prolyl cis-trans isomerase FkpA
MSTRIYALVVSVGLVLSSVVACSGDNFSAPTVNVPYSATDLIVGSGAPVSNGQTVTVAYTGWLYEEGAADNKGTLFEQASAASPFSFVLGAGQVIAGWDQGLVGMHVGGRRRLVIPPALAYGKQGAGDGRIPPNATLIFEVELLGVS